jgi:hypothetical protein
MSEERVKYVSAITKDKDGYRAQKYESINVETLFVKKYYNVLAILGGLNPCSRDLMEYLTEVMDDNNYVYNNALVRKAFIECLKNVTKKPDGTFVTYSDINVKKSYQTLVSKGSLIKLTKGMYKVNPRYYFKSDAKKRIQAIKILLEFQKGYRDYKMDTLYTLEEGGTEYKLTKE